MIRQAQSYLFGAVSGAAMVAAGVAVFVLLASISALHLWPVHLGGSAGTVTAPASGTAAAPTAAAALAPATGFVATRAPTGPFLAGGGVRGAPVKLAGGGGATSPGGPGATSPGGQSGSGAPPSSGVGGAVSNTLQSVTKTVGGALNGLGVGQTVQGVNKSLPNTPVGNAVKGTVGGVVGGLGGSR
jgi:hypothetical protein